MVNLDASLLGGDFTVASVIVLYQLTSVQYWYQRAMDYRAESEGVATSTALGDYSRAVLKRRCQQHRDNFPWIATLVLGVTLIAVTGSAIGLAVFHGTEKKQDYWFTLVPSCAIVVAYVVGTALSLLDGRRRLSESLRLLAA